MCQQRRVSGGRLPARDIASHAFPNKDHRPARVEGCPGEDGFQSLCLEVDGEKSDLFRQPAEVFVELLLFVFLTGQCSCMTFTNAANSVPTINLRRTGALGEVEVKMCDQNRLWTTGRTAYSTSFLERIEILQHHRGEKVMVLDTFVCLLVEFAPLAASR